MSESTPKAHLYVFPAGSVWSAPPVLTAIEKGYDNSFLETKVVDLLKGENFGPSFLKISPRGTVPALVVPLEVTVEEGIPTKFRAIVGTRETVAFLDTASISSSFAAPSLSPATVQGANDAKTLVDRVHAPDAPDPNALLLSFRNDDERKAKYEGIAGLFLRGRIAAIERYAQEAPQLKSFYDQKLQENKHLLALFSGEADSTQYQEQGRQMWNQVAATTAFFEERIKTDSDYLLGDFSIPDIHAGAFFARIFACAGAQSIQDPEAAISKLEQNINRPVGQPFKDWIARLFARQSFRQVYAEGLH